MVRALPAESAARILLLSGAAGVGAQYLFVGQQPGINLLLWVALVLGLVWLLRPPTARIDRVDAWLPIAALSFSAFVGLRDDPALRAFDIPAAGALTLAAAVALGGTSVSRSGLTALRWLMGAAVATALTGAANLRPGWQPLAPRLASNSAPLGVLRGLLVALPLVVVFGTLFAAADAIFAAYLASVFGWEVDVGEVLFRLLFAAAAAWLVAGTVVCAWLVTRTGQGTTDSQAAAPQAHRVLGRIEALVVLLALDLVFGFFVLLQGAYLFGGLDTLAVSGMSYSEYARRGFFELILVTALAGGVLLSLDRLVSQRGWAYRAAAVILAALTGVVLLSAVARLALYQQAYGWTELRFYALAVIGWLALGIVATGLSLLVDRAALVPRFMFAAGLAVALAVNGVGPQAFVSAQNLERAVDPSLVPAGGWSGVDFEYLDGLGDDSIPALIAALPQLSGQDRLAGERLLTQRAASLAQEARELGWPSWTLARQRAIDSLLAAGYLDQRD